MITVLCLLHMRIFTNAALEVEAPSAILIEASTGTVIYEKNATERMAPASVTKIMTLLLIFEALEADEISLDDTVVVSEHAASMGGSQVYLEAFEKQSVDTLIKCITVSSANDGAVAMAEFIAGSETAFVERMNKKALSLGMIDTNFEDCCGLSDSDLHYTSAKDVAIMSRELITKYPDIFEYTTIWMEDIIHTTSKGDSVFTLSSTNKLIKQYPYATGLKTGSTSKAKYCLSATALKDDVSLISVVLGGSTSADRFQDAVDMLNYGFSTTSIYTDDNEYILTPIQVKGSVEEEVDISYKEEFYYVDVENRNLSDIQKEIVLPEILVAPLLQGETVGYAVYTLNGLEIGRTEIICDTAIERASFGDYLKKAFHFILY
ncbi:MAG: D-alanyl-D-alanine carboxypeptidase family protein [Lachnospiraceae bacterium]